MNITPSHTISVLVSNAPGVLSRIATVFARRGYNIDSLVVSPALDGKYSRMTITACGEKVALDQIIKQLNKLIDVLEAKEYDAQGVVERELALLKVKLTDENRSEVLQVIQHFEGQTCDLTQGAVVVQVTGSSERLDTFVEMCRGYGLLELVRTGKVVTSRGV